MWGYEDTRAAVRDALRLSRAMTYKSAVADLPLGGGKGVVMLRAGRAPGRGRRRDALRDFADTVEALDGRYIAAEDVGTSSRDMTLIAERTAHVAGLSRRRGGSGDPSPFTALGVEAAIRASAERALGAERLRGRTAAVVGLGHVGARLAARLARAGVDLLVADIDPRRRELARKLGARWIDPERAMEAEVDVLAPCALGGVLDEQTVPRLQAPVVAGAANNQLADDGIADLLSARGVLWAPDFVANAGGIINISVEFDGYDPREARRRVNGIGDTVRRIYDDAQAIGATPLTAAMELARRRLARAA
jgi:leucine dehydrogenase